MEKVHIIGILILPRFDYTEAKIQLKLLKSVPLYFDRNRAIVVEKR